MGHLERAIEIDPSYARAYRLLGHSLRLGGDPDGALERYREEVALAPGSVPALTNLGDSLLELGDLEDAIKQYRAALALAPRSRALADRLEAALARQP